jgi:hypothetical protein
VIGGIGRQAHFFGGEPQREIARVVPGLHPRRLARAVDPTGESANTSSIEV